MYFLVAIVQGRDKLGHRLASSSFIEGANEPVKESGT